MGMRSTGIGMPKALRTLAIVVESRAAAANVSRVYFMVELYKPGMAEIYYDQCSGEIRRDSWDDDDRRGPPELGVVAAAGYGRGVTQMVACRCGRFHYGRYGAAGLVLSNDAGEVLIARRSMYVHRPGTWAFPGGALDHDESAEECAIREADEELGIPSDAIVVNRTVPGLDHGVWRYTYVMAMVTPGTQNLRLRLGWETDDAAWVPLDEVETLTLHPDLRTAWPGLLATW